MYLSNCKQSVKLNDILSSIFDLGEFGVLQGSILGVILFLIYINNLGTCSNSFFSILFADDLNSVVTANDTDDLCTKGNESLDTLMCWYLSNTL